MLSCSCSLQKFFMIIFQEGVNCSFQLRIYIISLISLSSSSKDRVVITTSTSTVVIIFKVANVARYVIVEIRLETCLYLPIVRNVLLSVQKCDEISSWSGSRISNTFGVFGLPKTTSQGQLL